MKVVIEPYDVRWPILFEQEKEKLHRAIGKIGIYIEHIGSTSVQGLSAKPTIDIMIGLEDFSDVNQFISPIEALVYCYVADYEDRMPFRRFFYKEGNNQRTYHLHMVEIESFFWKRHIGFRNRLRESENDRKAYEALKKELSQQNWNRRNEYAEAKSEFIRNIERKLNLNFK